MSSPTTSRSPSHQARMRKPLVRPHASKFSIYSRGRLPHWQVEEGLYCVTWRLADSLPLVVEERLREDYRRLKTQLGESPTSVQLAGLWVEFAGRLDEALHRGHGACVLRDPRAAAIVRDSLEFLARSRIDLIRWTIMPNHVHTVFKLRPGELLWKVMKSVKGYTSYRINQALQRAGTLWQREYFDVSIRDARELSHWIEYVEQNPVRAGLKDWPWHG